MNYTEKSLQLENSGTRIYAMLHMPAAKPSAAVLFCNPIFEERKSAHRLMVETARELCRRNLAVLRFDYRGQGDSGGNASDFSVSDWISDTNRAASHLSEIAGSDLPFIVLGVRFGANIAVNCNTANLAVLWEPPANGREYLDQELRKKLVKETMTAGETSGSRSDFKQTLDAGSTLDFDGHPITARLYNEICSSTLSSPTMDSRIEETLIINITSRNTISPQVLSAKSALSAIVPKIEGLTVREQPFWNLIGYVSCPWLISLTADWICKRTEQC